MNSIFKRFTPLLFATFAVPLHQDGSWQKFSFTRIQQNKFTFQKNNLKIEVDSSASPLIYKFSDVKKIKSIKARFKISGDPLNLNPKLDQGFRKNDDFSFRLGLVKKGSKSLNWMERQMAPSWVLKMYELAPKGTGIDSIHFLVATQQADLVNYVRLHPLS
ncbi:MAG: hypothetical protein HRT44_10490, partial [Bdellovibrionales bacterium]|nr:hypothetical protein [Bdellovibrionales bacterium]NQZ19668.1 hypothetical protein [Bdellovibrionales bacterium]